MVALREYGCISCHTIPGVRGADAVVGPPLMWWADRHYIAGRVANTPDNLVRFIQSPDAISPGTAMPDMDVSQSAAEDISAYLYTLRREAWWPATR
jgi:cytochrome c